MYVICKLAHRKLTTHVFGQITYQGTCITASCFETWKYIFTLHLLNLLDPHFILCLQFARHLIHINCIGWPKMHDVFKSLLPRYFLKDIYVKWSQFEFQTIWSNFHYTPRRSKFLLTIIVLANFNCTLVLNFFSINVFQKLQLNYSMDRQYWELSFDV